MAIGIAADSLPATKVEGAMLPLLFMLQADAGAVGAMVDAYRAKISADARCRLPAGDDVVVCGRRDADRYRAPLIVHDPGDPQIQDVPAERERLLARTDNCREKSVFLVGCGAFGVSVSTRQGFSEGVRPLAP